jgi:hypothetical protein
MNRRNRTRESVAVGAASAGIALALAAGGMMNGCALVGGMLESYRQTGTRSVEAEYLGLVGKSYAVVVIADRAIEADFPGLSATITERVNQNIHDQGGAGGWIPSIQLVQYITNNPQLLARPRGELANDLGVQRLIVIELQEFRLNDPGNQYLWEGQAAGTVLVIEADGPLPDDSAFTRAIRVGFPDEKGIGPEQYGRDVISSALLKRFVDRVSWIFYTHEEPYYPKY